jgi:phage gpG-like protein
MITIEIDNRSVLTALNNLAGKIDNMRPAFAEIGEKLKESTQARFNTSTGPDGQRWAPNSQATILSYLSGKSGSYQKKSGKISAKGSGYAMNKRPLVDTGQLQGSIIWQHIDNGVVIGTDRFSDSENGGWEAGAAVHQFGNKKGTIPARPFLGVSDEDEQSILSILSRYLGQP